MKKTLFYLTAFGMIITMLVSASACSQGGTPTPQEKPTPQGETPTSQEEPTSQKKISLKVLNAGSLMVPFKELEKEFESQRPNVDVLIEGHGSIQVIRHATEVAELTGEPGADVVAVADYSLIPMLMYQRKIPNTTENYADWNIKFATNRLGIAYNPQSKYADELNSTNWYEVLSRPDVKVGIADPRFDSCGYRTLMLCQLAELYYDNETIFENVLGKFDPPITVEENDGLYTIEVPEILQPEKISLRGSSINLLALLKSGDVDYAFGYESEAEQQGFKFLELPPEIDLSSEEYQDLYKKITVELGFQRFASVIPKFVGEPIIYGITIPKNAPHSELAIEFVKFVISPSGQKVFLDAHQPPLIPPEVDNLDNLPQELKSLFVE